MADRGGAAAQAQTGPGQPKQPGRWRLLTFACLALAVIFCLITLIGARHYDDLPDGAARASGTVAVSVDPTFERANTVVGLTSGAEAISLGDSKAEFKTISGGPNLIAALDGQGEIVAMGLAQTTTESLTLTPSTTAQALLVLAPSILSSNLGSAMGQVEVFAADPAFSQLSAALSADTPISLNEPAQKALAEILDRVATPRPLADQGCDSVSSVAAIAIAGGCARPSQASWFVGNEQDRWIVAFADRPSWTRPCSLLAPTGDEGAARTIGRSECGSGPVLLAAAGPVTNFSDREMIAEDDLRSRRLESAAVNVVGDYAKPFAAMTSGLSKSPAIDLVDTTAAIDGYRDLIANDPSIAGVTEAAAGPTRSAAEHHRSTIDLTASIFDGLDLAWVPEADSPASKLLDFYAEVGTKMVATRSAQRWIAPAVGFLEVDE